MTSKTRIEQIKTFLIQTPDDTFLNYALATELVAISRDQDALLIFKKLVTEKPDYFATYYHIGKLYERMGEDDLAEAMYKQGLEITKRLGEKHAYGELRGAFEELTF